MTPATVELRDAIKARGAFYTPSELTQFLVRWAIRTPVDRVLEPSCGDGVFIAAIAERHHALGVAEPGAGLLGVERDRMEAEKARAVLPSADIRTLNFFDLDPASVAPVDVAIGNPPYIRYQGFIGADREKALGCARAQGVELTGLASSWAHFVVHAAGFLNPGGRLALVVPAELLHTDYGQAVRDFLLKRFRSVVVVVFDQMVFAEAQVDAVLLLASDDAASGLKILRVKDETALATLDPQGEADETTRPPAARWSAAIHPAAGQVYEDAIVAHGGWRLGDTASVDIGFVSGANSFFVLSEAQARDLDLPREILTPAFRRPRDVPGLEAGASEVSWLVDLAGRQDLDEPTRRYLEHGVAQGIQQRYKCRVRKPWYAVPLPRRRPDAFIPYMAHLGPRLIVNPLGAKNSNLLHGVALQPGAPPARALSAAMCGSLTLLSAEIEGRAYGGGVLKLETREAERLVVPALSDNIIKALEGRFGQFDQLVREGRPSIASAIVDEVLGVDHERIWAAYITFRARRLGRRQSAIA